MSRRIADNPARLKWCSGPCGRQKPVADFHTNGNGYPAGECKRCHSMSSRDRFRKRYRNKPAFRRLSRRRADAWKEAHREERLAYFRAYNLARKLRGAAA